MNRILDYVLMEEEPPNPESKLLPFLAIYPFQGENHHVIIYASNWSEAHNYAHYHKMIVKEKVW